MKNLKMNDPRENVVDIALTKASVVQEIISSFPI